MNNYYYHKVKSAAYWIDYLQLEKHPKGGWYKKNYVKQRSTIPTSFSKNINHKKTRSITIYYLLEGHDFSTFHRMKSDEIWYYYTGSPLNIYELSDKGEITNYILGNDPHKGHTFQAILKGGNWLAAQPIIKHSYTLIGCTLEASFDFQHIEKVDKKKLLHSFPQHQKIIEKLTR